MPHGRLSLVGLALFAVGSACSSGDAAAVDRTLDGTWVVTEIDGQPIVSGENTEVVPFLEIDAGEAVGSFGCNSGAASLVVDGDVLDVVEAGSEDEACASVTVSFAENAISEVLATRRIGLTLEDGRMVWVAAGRQIILTEAAEPPP